MKEHAPIRRFSLLYLERNSPIIDSKTARFRLQKMVERLFSHSNPTREFETRSSAIKLIEHELGIEFATLTTAGRRDQSWSKYFSRISINHFLDTMTLLFLFFRSTGGRKLADKMLMETRRIFVEENLAYKIDNYGCVHPVVDSAFSVAHQYAIAELNETRYNATAELVQKADSFLLSDPPDYIAAIRSIFGACENLFKLIFNVLRLDSSLAKGKLEQHIQAQYAETPSLQSANIKPLAGFKSWIESAHYYRHEQGVEEHRQPNEEIAVLLVSHGLAYVRWLAKLDKNINLATSEK